MRRFGAGQLTALVFSALTVVGSGIVAVNIAEAPAPGRVTAGSASPLTAEPPSSPTATPTPAPTPTPTPLPPHTWELRSIDTMAWTKDRLETQPTQAQVDAVVAADASAHANTLAVEVPYDDASTYRTRAAPGYLERWVSAARAHGLHVWFRAHWNSWEGDWSSPKRTPTSAQPIALGTAAGVLGGGDRTSYLGLTYAWILAHPGLFQAGDIFTPAAEPQNVGIQPHCAAPCTFTDVAQFNRWLRDSMTVDRQAFAHLGVTVAVGYWGTGCDDPAQLEPATVQEMGVLAVDCYERDPSVLQSRLTALEREYGAPMVLGEWGDVWDGGAEPTTSDEIDAVLRAIQPDRGILGVNYWRDVGGSERIVDPTRLQLNAAGRHVASWFEAMTTGLQAP